MAHAVRTILQLGRIALPTSLLEASRYGESTGTSCFAPIKLIQYSIGREEHSPS